MAGPISSRGPEPGAKRRSASLGLNEGKRNGCVCKVHQGRRRISSRSFVSLRSSRQWELSFKPGVPTSRMELS